MLHFYTFFARLLPVSFNAYTFGPLRRFLSAPLAVFGSPLADTADGLLLPVLLPIASFPQTICMSILFL